MIETYHPKTVRTLLYSWEKLFPIKRFVIHICLLCSLKLFKQLKLNAFYYYVLRKLTRDIHSYIQCMPLIYFEKVSTGFQWCFVKL